MVPPPFSLLLARFFILSLCHPCRSTYSLTHRDCAALASVCVCKWVFVTAWLSGLAWYSRSSLGASHSGWVPTFLPFSSHPETILTPFSSAWPHWLWDIYDWLAPSLSLVSEPRVFWMEMCSLFSQPPCKALTFLFIEWVFLPGQGDTGIFLQYCYCTFLSYCYSLCLVVLLLESGGIWHLWCQMIDSYDIDQVLVMQMWHHHL